MKFVIAIDGPAGSGKTTTARESARELGMIYLDTGAMYRAAALFMHRRGIEVLNENDVKKYLKDIDISFRNINNSRRIFLNSEDVSDAIRNETISQKASEISTLKSVRFFLAGMQRKIGSTMDIVAEGRDMGTVVFPDAPLKFFMECSIEERARRRAAEYRKDNPGISIEEIRKQIEIRDRRDTNRQYAPLRMADDAILINTTNMTKEEQIKFVVSKAKKIRENIQSDTESS
ncbi:MAG: (d)CMP kinase [bacterium]